MIAAYFPQQYETHFESMQKIATEQGIKLGVKQIYKVKQLSNAGAHPGEIVSRLESEGFDNEEIDMIFQILYS